MFIRHPSTAVRPGVSSVRILFYFYAATYEALFGGRKPFISAILRRLHLGTERIVRVTSDHEWPRYDVRWILPLGYSWRACRCTDFLERTTLRNSRTRRPCGPHGGPTRCLVIKHEPTGEIWMSDSARATVSSRSNVLETHPSFRSSSSEDRALLEASGSEMASKRGHLRNSIVST